MWRIRLDSSTNCFVLEVRDPDVLLTYFYTLETEEFKLEQLPLQQAKAWWQGLEEAEYGLVYLHGYGDKKLGQHIGISAIHPKGGHKVWEQPKLSFYGLSRDGLLTLDPLQPEEPLQILDPFAGKATGKTLSQLEAAEQVALYTKSRYAAWEHPVMYREGEAYFEQVQSFLNLQLGVTAVQGIEYAETPAHLVISFYTSDADDKLTNKLAVFDLEGKLLMQMQLGSSLSGIGSDTFFIFKHNLYFILNRVILQVFRLTV